MIYEIGNKYFPKNILELNTQFEYKNSNFKINTVESLKINAILVYKFFK